MDTITKVVLKNAFRKDKKIERGRKDKFFSILSFLIVFLTLSGTMLFSSILVTKKLKEFGQSDAYIAILLLLNFIILFAKNIFEVIDVLYFSKDLKIWLRMPIKSKKLINAKLLEMIFSEYEMEIIMLAIPMMVYGYYAKVNFVFYLYMIIILLILPVIPTVIVSLITALIMRFTNSIKNKSRAMYISLILCFIILGVLAQIFISPNNNFAEINEISDGIENSFILLKPIMGALLNYNNLNGLKNLCIYFFSSIILYYVILNIMSKIYLKGAIGATIDSENKNNIIKNEITVKDFMQKDKYKSYVEKEFKIIKRYPIMLIQCIVMPIVYPILGFIAMAFLMNYANSMNFNISSNIVKIIPETLISAVLLSIGTIFFMVNFSSTIAISKESTSAELTKYIPINFEKQIRLKIRIGELINIITTILVTISYYYLINNAMQSILVFIDLSFLNAIGEKYKILNDLKEPKITWNSEYIMMKENSNVMNVLFITIFIVILNCILGFFIQNVYIYFTICICLGILANIFVNNYIHKNQIKIFERL